MFMVGNQRSILLQSRESLSRGYPSLDLDTVYEEKSDTHGSSQHSESPVGSRAPSPTELTGPLLPIRTNTITGTIATAAYGAYGKDRDDTVLELVRGKRKRFRNTKHKRLAVSHSETNLTGLGRTHAACSSGVISPASARSPREGRDAARVGRTSTTSFDETTTTSATMATAKDGKPPARYGSRKKAPRVQRQKEVCEGIRAPLWTTLTHAQTISDYEI
uniref:Uncharacterized protein n=1 Tax=Anopheles arabiensis TaxID=7173 RepID=A0A182HU73_ANOAR